MKGLTIIFTIFINSVLFSIYSVVDPAGAALLQKLFDSHYAKLLGIANQILRNHADAEEAVSDAYFKVWQNLDEFEGLSEVDTIKLLTVIAKNSARDRQRKNNAKKNQKDSLVYEEDDILKEFDIPDMDSNPEFLTITQERVEKVTEYIDALPEPDHTIFILKFKFRQQSSEIAKQLGMTRSQVDNRVSRARVQLREDLKEWKL